MLLILIASTVIISSLVFANVYGPGLVSSFKASKELREIELQILALQEEQQKLNALAELNNLNEQLRIAFGGIESRTLEMPLEVDCEYYDSELILILEDDTLTTSQAIEQINELLVREEQNA